MRTAHKVLVRNSEEGRCLRGMEGDTVGIRMDRTETGCDDVEWIHLAQDRGQTQAPMNTVIVWPVKSHLTW
jgi:hypothetical protein